MNAGGSGLSGDGAVDKSAADMSAVGEAVVGEIHGYPLHADDAAQWQAAGDAAARGAHAAAADVIQTLCDRRPHLLPARIQAGYYRLSAGAYRAAESIALAAADACADAPPRTPEAAAALIALLRVFEAHQAMAEVVDRTDWSTCRDPGVLVGLVQMLAGLALYPQAERLLARADALAPGHPMLAYTRGIFAFVRGDRVASQASLARALPALPQHAAHIGWLRAMQARRDDAEASLRAQVAHLRATRVNAGSGDAAYRAYALHRLHDALGEHAAAWDALAEGNAIKAAAARHDPDADRALFEALRALPATAAGAFEDDGSAPPPVTRTLFVVGMHRSGTSVLERVLSGHSAVVDGGENHVFPAAMRWATDHRSRGVLDLTTVERAARLGPEDWADVGRRIDAYAAWRSGGAPWFIEKLPPNALHAGFILRAMPHARVLCMRRDPMDTCFSNLRTFFADGIAPYASEQRALARYALGHADLMRHWLARARGRMVEVDYAAFVADPHTEVLRLCAWLGLDVEPRMLDVGRDTGYTATASIADVRRGILRDRGGAWRPYAAWLRPMQETLARIGADTDSPPAG